MTDIPEPFGPTYPNLGASVAKYRRLANKAGSIRDMAKADRRAYADAIEKAIRAKHRTLHMRPTPSPSSGWCSPPAISRLLRWENPVPMKGDPHWHERNDRDKWGTRENAVYEAMIREKRKQ